MCRLPVTLGGGLTSVNGSASGRAGRNSPFASQWAYHRASIATGSKVLASSLIARGFASGRASGQRLPRRDFASIRRRMREWADFEVKEAGGRTTLALTGPLLVSSIGMLDRKLRAFDEPVQFVDLSGAGDIDTVGAWTVS